MSAEKPPLAFQGDVPYWGGPPVELSRKRSKLGKAAWFAGTGLGALSLVGGELRWAMDNKGTVANLSREIIGYENTQWIEKQYLAFNDYKTRKLYQFGLGPDEQPFDTPISIVKTSSVEDNEPSPTHIPPLTTGATEMVIAESFPLQETQPKKIRPFVLPDTHILLPNPLPGEGSWSIDGLPTTEDELTMAKTFIRLDSSRPYANVAVIVFDSRRVNLNMVGGAFDRRNGGDKGPGKVPSQDLSNLLVVMNGGFQFDHARQNFNTTRHGNSCNF